MRDYDDIFPLCNFAENIFTYTERYRGLIENEILLGNYGMLKKLKIIELMLEQ